MQVSAFSKGEYDLSDGKEAVLLNNFLNFQVTLNSVSRIVLGGVLMFRLEHQRFSEAFAGEV